MFRFLHHFSFRYLLNFPIPIEFTPPLYKEHLTDDVLNQHVPYLWQIYWWEFLWEILDLRVNCLCTYFLMHLIYLRVYYFEFLEGPVWQFLWMLPDCCRTDTDLWSCEKDIITDPRPPTLGKAFTNSASRQSNGLWVDVSLRTSDLYFFLYEVSCRLSFQSFSCLHVFILGFSHFIFCLCFQHCSHCTHCPSFFFLFVEPLMTCPKVGTIHKCFF